MADITRLPHQLLQENNISRNEKSPQILLHNSNFSKKEAADEELKKADNKESQYQSKGYIKYPAYDFF
jgi:hypothetical protein